MFLKGITCVFLLTCFICICSVTAKAQNTSNKGKDFWLGYGNHVRDWQISQNASEQQMSVYITSDVNTAGTIEIPGIGYSASYNVSANNITIIDIPNAARLRREGKSDLGIHITAEKPVVVYSHIFASNVSGATLVLPTPTLGKDYYSINYTQVSNEDNSYSYFFVVAVEDNTQVEITPSASTQNGWAAGSSNVISLNKGQVYQVLGVGTGSVQVDENGNGFPIYKHTGVDLTGSRIRSVTTTAEPCKRIAVFSGSGKIGIGCENFRSRDGFGSSDNLYQQAYPTTSWGKKFITAPLKSRNYDIIRIVRSDPSAVVLLNGNPVQFSNGFYHEFSTQRTNVIESTKPIQVVQYAVTEDKTINCRNLPPRSDTGDPEMIFLNAVEQNIEKITVYSADEYLIENHFINVVIETAAVPSFRLDGASRANQFLPVPGQADYSYAQLSVSAGVHTLAADKGFNAIAYGFGVAESYGYSAGANVKGISIQAESRINNELTNTGCVGEPLRFKVNLLYEPKTLTWDVGDGTPLREIPAPVATGTVEIDGKTYFVYELDEAITYNAAGDYTVEVVAEKTSSDGCGTKEEISLEFSVFNPPVAKLSVAPELCAGNAVQFTDQSDGKGRDIKTWLWDFGDGTASDEQNPLHTYALEGTYEVTLTVTNESNCYPVTSPVQNVTILKRPTSLFTTSTACVNRQINFTDQSTTDVGDIIKWKWDFGDGTPTSAAKNPIHTYALAGDYLVKLITETDKGCISEELVQNLTVNPLPVADFETPEICLEDEAKFINKSSIPNGDESKFTYLWNFGDGQTSTDENPKHNYSQTGDFTVTLMVTSEFGCASLLVEKQFTVNGSTPEAGFTVQNANQLCSSEPVVFEDNATVDGGQLTKIEWYFDYDPSKLIPDLIDEEPGSRAAPKQYSWQYPPFNSPATRTVTVKMVAYSGIACFEEITQTITLKASPDVFFDAIPEICEEEGPIQLTQGYENSAFAGTGEYSGPGVSAAGLFTPSAAGDGTHTLTYTFTGDNGCSVSKTQTITVYPTPELTIGNDLGILEGGEVVIDAKATGNGLTYKWYPATGLSRDDILNPVASPAADMVYTLTVTSAQGCVAVDDVAVKVLQAPVIPNTFTPNGDGINDVWNIQYLSTYTSGTVDIFNRYGVKMFSVVGYPTPWDGKFNGSDLPVGTYYYIINPKNGSKTYSGSITILR